MALSNARSTVWEGTLPRLPGLPPLPPDPAGGVLSVEVACSTSPDMSATTTHPVTLSARWEVATPHDLEAERVAAAFGGFLSCLLLVDKVGPAVREAVQMHARRRVPRIKRAVRGTWRPVASLAGPCCRAEPTAAAAAGHLRSREHTTARAGGQALLSSTLLDAVMPAHRAAGSFALDSDGAAVLRRCVLGDTGPQAVWQAGLHPSVVAAIHDEVVGADGPALPEALYLGVVSRRPDLSWLGDTVAAASRAVGAPITRYDPPALAQWLAWTATPLDAQQRRARRGWLATGVPREWIEELSRAGYSPADAQTLVAATGRSTSGVSAMLLSWVRAGCRPAVPDLLDLFASGVPAWHEPSGPSITRLHNHLGRLADRWSRTELGLVLAREGTVLGAASVLRAPAAPLPRKDCA